MTSRFRSIGVLIASNLFGGVGVAAGISAGGLLADELASTSWAGFAQASSTLGAAVAAIPLATMATDKGRRRSLSVGYAMSVIGALAVVGAAMAGHIIFLLIGMGLFGIAQAVILQTRYAAAGNVTLAARARGMSLVLWATTIGSVMGPNLLSVGNDFGQSLGLPAYTGPFVFSMFAFAAAGVVIALLFRPTPSAGTSPSILPALNAHAKSSGSAAASPVADPPVPDPSVATEKPLGAIAALRWAARQPIARFAVTLIAAAHAVMVMVMVMTPVHMEGSGDSLELVGITISLHVLGMYGLSPVFGWAIDRLGAGAVAAIGIAVELAALVTGFIAAAGNTTLMVTSLILLGLGWSAAILAGSSLVATITPPDIRVPLQGASDALMNYAGAAAAALAGPILAAGGFHLVNVVAAVILAPALVLYVPAMRAVRNLTSLARSK